jgi:hypothetical protein
MNNSKPLFWHAYNERDDLSQFGSASLMLFALQMKYNIEDISTIAVNSLTDGRDDKKVDLVYIDAESGFAVIAQAYISTDFDKKEAPSNKASDLNTAISWLFNRPIEELPITIKSHADELRNAIKEGSISSIYIWYIHNLPESQNVFNELITVEHSAKSIISSKYETSEIEIQAQEIGVNTLNEWYQSLSTPILINEDFHLPIEGGFKIEGEDWSSFVTSIPALWLYEQFQEYKTKLFSANVRDYLGSRKTDKNINSGIKQTVHSDPRHFWVYNNGITALVHDYETESSNSQLVINFKGISIVNGAQTTGAIGNLNTPPDSSAMVQIRFIKCQNVNTVYDIVKYNNSQNKITAPDFRSNDPIQRRLREEFEQIPSIEYFPRRGGHEDLIRRRSDVLPSVTAGQALASLHRDPDIAYHKKTNIWESDTLYSKYFNDQTNARHILFAHSLIRAIENKKISLLNKIKSEGLTEIESNQLDFYRKRGSIFMMASAIAKCFEIFLDKQIPNYFRLTFYENLDINQAIELWNPLVEISSSFSQPLMEGLSDGFRNKNAVNGAIQTFQSLISSTKQVNRQIYNNFENKVSIE